MKGEIGILILTHECKQLGDGEMGKLAGYFLSET